MCRCILVFFSVCVLFWLGEMCMRAALFELINISDKLVNTTIVINLQMYFY